MMEEYEEIEHCAPDMCDMPCKSNATAKTPTPEGQ